jgi:proteic killer suppression protein
MMVNMIQGFRCSDTQTLFMSGRTRRWPAIERAALRKLHMLDIASDLRDLGMIPGNRLESLSGDRAGQDSIRINDQWRVCFVWTVVGPTDVEIVDYH